MLFRKCNKINLHPINTSFKCLCIFFVRGKNYQFSLNFECKRQFSSPRPPLNKFHAVVPLFHNPNHHYFLVILFPWPSRRSAAAASFPWTRTRVTVSSSVPIHTHTCALQGRASQLFFGVMSHKFKCGAGFSMLYVEF